MPRVSNDAETARTIPAVEEAKPRLSLIYSPPLSPVRAFIRLTRTCTQTVGGPWRRRRNWGKVRRREKYSDKAEAETDFNRATRVT